jgi:large subunit ribosomal protein L9
MKVILTERVPSLGNVGEIVNVSQGYARNYLIPQKVAVVADKAHKKTIENQQRVLAKKVEEAQKVALDVKNKLDGLKLELIKKVGANGKLFGSVTTVELSKALAEKGLNVERKLMTLKAPIKSIGNYEVDVKLFNNVHAVFSVSVVMDPEQAKELKEKEAEAKKAKAEKAKNDANNENKEEVSEENLTEEQMLKKKADEILRS